jgi:hypothetical protein
MKIYSTGAAMDLEQLETFFKLYLDEAGLKYKLKERIYRIILDKEHKKLFGSTTLAVTFDAPTAKKIGVQLIGIGTFIFDALVVKYTQGMVAGNVEVPHNKRAILDVDERLPDLKREGQDYNIEESTADAIYVLFEIRISTAKRKMRRVVPILQTKEGCYDGTGFEKANMKLIKKEFKPKAEIEKAITCVPALLGAELTDAEKEHDTDMKELLAIQEAHCQEKYKEIQLEEDKVKSKILEMEDKAVSANSFDSQANYSHKVKTLKTKLEKLVKKNEKKRETIKQDSDRERLAVKQRELSVTADILSVVKVDNLQTFIVKYKDASFTYIPILGRFLQNA